MTLQYKPGTDMNHHLATMNRIKIDLLAAGVNVSDIELTTALYRSMPKTAEWSGLIQSLSTAHALTPVGQASMVTFQFVSNQFREQYHLIAREKTSLSSSSSTKQIA